ncbi:chromatin assembly factor 1 subunit A-domain-containing protein [Xylariales sp. PMI_506]|nr:chromatin assembly factor 1 subunit A-domain-containing protein [Xylariales sp. PMI_506]
MPLFDISVNIQESEAASRKRNHNEFRDSLRIGLSTTPEFENAKVVEEQAMISASETKGSIQSSLPSVAITDCEVASPPGSSSPAALTETGSSTPAQNSPSPNKTPFTSPLIENSASCTAPDSPTTNLTSKSSSMTSVSTPPNTMAATAAKRKRKTAEEKEAEERERQEKRAKKEEELAAKAAERAEKDAAKAAEKAEKDAAKAAEKAEKDAAKAAKAAEKAKADAEKEAKAAKKKEEEEKKKRAQPSLFQFMKAKQQPTLTPTSPSKPPSSNTLECSPSKTPSISSTVNIPCKQEAQKPGKSAYNKLFQDFFVKPDVTMAPIFLMNEETRDAKSGILDEYIRAERAEFDAIPFNPNETLGLSGLEKSRGVQYEPVKKIMAQMFGDPLDSVSGIPPLRTESQQVRLAGVQDQLNTIPVKILSFYEDVRPPYVGTLTSTSKSELQKLARRPTGRHVLKLNYDYDSEAEWEEEEGEDLDDDEVDDEENEADEEMADFLDDADDVAMPAARTPFLADLQPVSTGICFENAKRLSHDSNGEPCATVYKYRMEFLLESLEHHHSIDPFSTAYWHPQIVNTKESSSTQTKLTSAPVAGMAPPPIPRSVPSATDAKDLVDKKDMEEFKKAIVSADINFLTKAGIVDMLSRRFPNATKAQLKNTLELVADRCSVPGEKKTNKRWALRPGYELVK